MANIWGNAVLRTGNSVYQKGHIGHGKGRGEKGSVGHRAKSNRAWGDAERRPGLEARIKSWV